MNKINSLLIKKYNRLLKLLMKFSSKENIRITFSSLREKSPYLQMKLLCFFFWYIHSGIYLTNIYWELRMCQKQG